MSQVSRNPVNKHIQKTIQDSFRWLITSLRQREDVDIFLQDFLTKTEKVMLAKRLAIALLLEKGYGYQEIMHVLKVSPSTISKTQQLLESGKGYRVAIKKLIAREELDTFWKDVLSLVHMIGKGRKVFG